MSLNPKLFHTVLISFLRQPDPRFPNSRVPSNDEKQEIFERYAAIAEDCGGEEAGILFFRVDENLDCRKNVDLVEIAVFRDEAALEAFRTHPKHTELTNLLRSIANWWVGDIPIRVAPALALA